MLLSGIDLCSCFNWLWWKRTKVSNNITVTHPSPTRGFVFKDIILFPFTSQQCPPLVNLYIIFLEIFERVCFYFRLADLVLIERKCRNHHHAFGSLIGVYRFEPDNFKKQEICIGAYNLFAATLSLASIYLKWFSHSASELGSGRVELYWWLSLHRVTWEPRHSHIRVDERISSTPEGSRPSTF